MVDLSLPHELLATLMTLIDAVRNKIEQILSSEEARANKLKEKLLESTWKRLGEDHQVSSISGTTLALRHSMLHKLVLNISGSECYQAMLSASGDPWWKI